MRNWGNVNFCAAVCLLLLGGSPPLSSALHRQRRVAGENDLWGNPCDYTGVSISSEDQKEIAEELVKQAKLALERAEPYKDILASQLDSYSKFEDLLKLYEGEAWLRDFPWYKDAVLPKQKKLHSPIDAKYINKILGDSLDHDLPAIHKGLKMIVAGMWAFKTVGLNDGIEYDDALKQGIDNTMSDSSAVLCHMSDLMTARGIASWPLLEDEIPNLTTENKLKMEVLIYRDTLNYLEYIQQLFQQFIELQGK